MMRLPQMMVWAAIAALALVTAPLLARDLLAITRQVALDPNEGWNAAHVLRWLAGGPLYPPQGGWMVNNYPPLSFYIVGALTRLTHDAVIAGRLLSALSFLAICGLIPAVLQSSGATPRAALLAMLVFAAILLIAGNYVAMDDPQMLGHALQMAALLLLLRGRGLFAAALFALSLFVKHNLLAMPLAAGLWLLSQDRRAGSHFLLWGLAFVLAGLVAFQLRFGESLFSQLASPRHESAANLWQAVQHLWWAVLPAWAASGARPGRTSEFGFTYAALALALGLVFSLGDGVDANAFFDLAIALALLVGLMPDHGQTPMIASLSALPLLAVLALNFHDNNFFYTRAFAARSQTDIAFLKSRPGPVLCDQLSLCLWAGKQAELDVFNVGEAIRTRARDPGPLIGMIQKHHFATIQLQDMDGLGPQVKDAVARAYRVNHIDDNGSFLTPVAP
jgi:hypothetical protein